MTSSNDFSRRTSPPFLPFGASKLGGSDSLGDCDGDGDAFFLRDVVTFDFNFGAPLAADFFVVAALFAAGALQNMTKERNVSFSLVSLQ